MGIQDLFSNEADLSAMSSSAGVNRLRVSNVFHQATLEVNEGGSEASAASGDQPNHCFVIFCHFFRFF